MKEMSVSEKKGVNVTVSKSVWGRVKQIMCEKKSIGVSEVLRHKKKKKGEGEKERSYKEGEQE